MGRGLVQVEAGIPCSTQGQGPTLGPPGGLCEGQQAPRMRGTGVHERGTEVHEHSSRGTRGDGSSDGLRIEGGVKTARRFTW